MEMALVRMHHILRYIVFAGLLSVLVISAFAIIKNKRYSNGNKVVYLLVRAILGLQGGVGLMIYIIDGYSSMIRHPEGILSPVGFFTILHPVSMITGIILVSFGFNASHKTEKDRQKHKKIVIYYGLGTLVICAGIPWPFYF